jgi:hypothetical protein
MGMSDKAKRVKDFHKTFRTDDAEAVAVRAELERLFPLRAAGTPRYLESYSYEEQETYLGETAGLVRFSDPLDAAPAAVRELVTFMIAEDVVDGTKATKMEKQSLFGVYDFDELNGPEGIVGDAKARGAFPVGVFCIGENVFVDASGEIGSTTPGAVYKAYGFELAGAELLAPSVSAFLAKCGG